MSEDRHAAEISDAALYTAIQTAALPRAAMRGELVASPRREVAAQIVAGTRDPRDAWQRLGDFEPPAPAVRERWLFHLRRGSTTGTPRRLVRELRAAAITLPLCPSPDVPPALCLGFPPSVRDAVGFTLLAPLLVRAEDLLAAATRALDVLGQGTHALSRLPVPRVPRRVVWAAQVAGRPDRLCRPALLLAMKLLEQLGDGAWWRPTELGLPRDALPAGYYGDWPQLGALAVGMLAWRAAVRAGLRVTATHASPGSRLYVNADAVGRGYTELANPFEALLELWRLGVVLRGYSTLAIAAVVCVDP